MKYSDVLRTIVLTRKKECFRNNIVIEPLYGGKCNSCGKEYEELPTDKLCERCKLPLIEPDQAIKAKFEKWSEDVNENHQSLIKVQESLFIDENIIDDQYQMILKEYYWDENNNLLKADIKEVIRADPLSMRIICDLSGRPGRDDEGKKVYTCLVHRESLYKERHTCPRCGKPLFQAFFKAEMETSGSMGATGNKGTYYVAGEVKHTSEFYPSFTYGFSPVATVWQKVVTLMYQDSYIKEYYGKERPPRGILVFNTSNAQSLKKAWLAHKEESRNNPHDISPIALEFAKGSSGSGKMVEWIEFVKPLTDMQYVETRNEYRRIIGAVWGVQPIFQGDIQQSGGLNNEGLQVAVTNRSIESGQAPINENLREIADQFGMTEAGWKVILGPVEERDEMSELLIEKQKIDNANSMKSLGYEVTLDDDGEFEFTKMALTPTLPGVPPTNPNPSNNNPLDISGMPEKSKKKSLLSVYRDEAECVMKSDPGFVAKALPSEEKLSALKDGIYSRKFEGLSKQQSNLIKDYLISAVEHRIPYSDMVDQVKLLADLDDAQAESIVRTETHELRMKLRQVAYEERLPEDAKYKWIGPSDDRTSPVCKDIVDATRNGVTLPELQGIIKEKADKYGLKARDFTPHPNCRHVYVRAV
jgi:hypothetical protein